MTTAPRITCSMLLLVPGIAAAHPGHDFAMSAIDGLLHPLTGLDHVLAMIATGLWASHLGKRATLTLPVVFVLAMLFGGTLSMIGIGLPALEPMIALSVAVFGLVIAARVRVSEVIGAALVATFAVFHGYAHASEASGLQIPFAVGFSIATMSLSAAGIWLGARFLSQKLRVTQVAGSLISASGAMLLLGI
jgi:urease accessory protein